MCVWGGGGDAGVGWVGGWTGVGVGAALEPEWGRHDGGRDVTAIDVAGF